jgi:L-noviosyl transferase
MRIMLTTCPAQGHLFPAVPLAWALRNAGHDVLVPLPTGLIEVGRATGLAVAETADVDMMRILAETFQPLMARGFATATEEERSRYGVLGFTRLAAASVADIIRVADGWGPDVILHDAVEFAGPLAAARIEVPTVAYGWGTWLPPQTEAAVAEAMAPLYKLYAVDRPVPTPAARIDVCPPSLSGPRPELKHLRFVPYNGAGSVPDWLLVAKPHRRILVTFGGSVGTTEQRKGHPLLTDTLTALEGINAEVVVAAPYTEGMPERRNLRLERWLPLSYVLPGCDLVIHHGGSGTTLTAAAYGVPQLILPQMADHFRFAAAIERVGAGEQLMPGRCTPEAIGAAAHRLLDPGSAGAKADLLSEEIAALPPVAELATVVEQVLALDDQPVVQGSGG